MKAPRLRIGSGTLGRFKRSQPLVSMTLRDNGYGPTIGAGKLPVSCWTNMTAREARKLAMRLERAADRAEGRVAR